MCRRAVTGPLPQELLPVFGHDVSEVDFACLERAAAMVVYERVERNHGAKSSLDGAQAIIIVVVAPQAELLIEVSDLVDDRA